MDEFYRDVREKKSLVPSSRHKKSGARSMRCRLPSDHMTQREWIERNGPVMSYNLRKPMSWEQFTNEKLGNDVREEYLNGLIEQFSVNQRILAEMFGISVATLSRTIKRLGLNVNFVKGKFPNEEQMAAYEAFLNPEVEQEELEQQEEYDTAIDESEAQEPAQNAVTSMTEFSIKFQGVLDIDTVANSLKMILGRHAEGEIEIICKIR